MLLVRLVVFEIGTWNYVVRRNGILRLVARASTVTTWRVRTHSFFMSLFLLFFVFIRFFLVFCSPLSFLANSNLSIFSFSYIFFPVSVSSFLLSSFCFRPFRFLPLLPTCLESLFFRIRREKCCLTHYCPCSECKSKNIAESNRCRA